MNDKSQNSQDISTQLNNYTKDKASLRSFLDNYNIGDGFSEDTYIDFLKSLIIPTEYENLEQAERELYFRYKVCIEEIDKISMFIFLSRLEEAGILDNKESHLLMGMKLIQFFNESDFLSNEKKKRMLEILQILCSLQEKQDVFFDKVREFAKEKDIESDEFSFAEGYGLIVGEHKSFCMQIFLLKLEKKTKNQLEKVYFYDIDKEYYQKVIDAVAKEFQFASYSYRLIIMPISLKEIPPYKIISQESLGLCIAILTYLSHINFWKQLPFIATGKINLDKNTIEFINKTKDKKQGVKSMWCKSSRFLCPAEQLKVFSDLPGAPTGIDELEKFNAILQRDPLEIFDDMLASFFSLKWDEYVKKLSKKDFIESETYEKDLEEIEKEYIKAACSLENPDDTLIEITRQDFNIRPPGIVCVAWESDPVKAKSMFDSTLKYHIYRALWKRRNEFYTPQNEKELHPWPLVIPICELLENIENIENWICSRLPENKKPYQHILKYALEHDRILFIIPVIKTDGSKENFKTIQGQFDKWKTEGRKHQILWMVNDLVHYTSIEILNVTFFEEK